MLKIKQPYFPLRHSQHVFSILTLLLAVFGTSCSPSAKDQRTAASVAGIEKSPEEKSKEETLPITAAEDQLWGMEFKHIPISEASEREQEWGKAVALVRKADGSAATGFFISEDGLFLTNHHVISRVSCSRERCAGVQVVRNFAPTGAIEIFENLHVIAQNQTLDFALIKVDLQPGKTVPYLELATRDEDILAYDLNDDALYEKDLVILGHPLGASLRVSASVFEWEENSELTLRDNGLDGNSGSPLIDKASGRVFGLYRAGVYDESSIDMGSKILKEYGKAVSINAIRKTLIAAYPKYTGQFPLVTGLFDTVLESDKRRDLLPRETADHSWWVGPSTKAWFGTELGTPMQQSSLENLISDIRKLAAPFVLADEFVWDWIQVQQSRGESLTLAPSIVTDLLGLLENQTVGENTVTLLKATQGLLSAKDCQNELSNTPTPGHLARWLTYCRISSLPDGSPILDYVLSQVLSESLSQEESEKWIRRGGGFIREAANQGLLDIAQVPKTLQALAKIVKHCRTLGCAYKAEAFFTFLQRDPSLVGKGAFKTCY